MKNQLLEKLNAAVRQLQTRCSLKGDGQSARVETAVATEPKSELEKPLAVAYRLMGDRSARFMPLFTDLDANLQKAGLRFNFKAYVSLTVLAAFLAALAAATVVPLLLVLFFNMSFGSALLFGVGGALFTWVLTVFGFYLYPVYQADKHRRELDDELSFTTGYMAILASAGVHPEKIFYSMSALDVPLAASREARDVVKNINLFGLDIISALEKVSSRTPSDRLRETIEGIISVIHTGGNMGGYLRDRFKSAMKLKRLSLKKYSDSLSVLSEVYVALLLTGPLLLVIMVSVMAVLGGGGLGVLSPDLLLGLLTYIGIPVGAAIFLIILDSTSPKW
jgi:flagellar protein FlaJ